jgi:hypothetical protein
MISVHFEAVAGRREVSLGGFITSHKFLLHHGIFLHGFVNFIESACYIELVSSPAIHRVS